MVFADFDVEPFWEFRSSGAVFVLFALFMVIVVIIIMNMLIAVMGDTYERVAGQMNGMLQYQKAEIIAEAELFYAGPSRRGDPRLHGAWFGVKCVLLMFCIPFRPSSSRVRKAIRWALPAGGDWDTMFPRWLHMLHPKHGADRSENTEWEGRLKGMYGKMEEAQKVFGVVWGAFSLMRRA